MEKAYVEIDWEDRPSTATPLDEQNLDAMSRALSTIDDRVIDLYNAQQDSVKSIAVNETTGLITVTKNDGTSYTYNPSTRIYTTLASYQQTTQQNFAQVNRNFGDVHDMLDAMDLKVDLNAETTNQGLTNLQTQITQNDGYYRQEMSGISTDLTNVQNNLNNRIDATNTDITLFKSSITQTTQAIQLSVSSVSGTVSDLSDSLTANVTRLQSEIDVTAGSIAMKVSKFEVIDDLTQEFGSGIQITPDYIAFVSDGAALFNTTNFKLDEDGNAEFSGKVAMGRGSSVDGVEIVPGDSDGGNYSIDHSHDAWKLRTARVSGDERYYVFMTKNKGLIVSNQHDGGHKSTNDVTDDCSIGFKTYPWKKGYFKVLRIQEVKNGNKVTHDVLPEGLPVTIPSTGWTTESGYYTYEMAVNGIKSDMYLYLATESKANLVLVYKHRIEVDTFTENTVTFIAETVPTQDVSAVLLVEDYISPSMEGADLLADYDAETNTLAAMWDSPDEFSKFISWNKDTIIIEKYNETTETWEQVFSQDATKDQYSTIPLIIGGT